MIQAAATPPWRAPAHVKMAADKAAAKQAITKKAFAMQAITKQAADNKAAAKQAAASVAKQTADKAVAKQAAVPKRQAYAPPLQVKREMVGEIDANEVRRKLEPWPTHYV